jgi:DNA (cytosine-5)-methyltransferase 1
MIPVTVEPGIAAREGGHAYEGVSGTLRANAGDNQMAVAYGISAYESNAMKSGNPHSGVYEADTSRTLDLNGGNPACNQGGIAIVEAVTDRNILDDQGGSQISVRDDGKCPTLRAEMHGNVPCVMETAGFCPETGGNDPSRSISYSPELSPTLRTGATPGVVYAVENHPADSRVNIDESGTVQTLTSRMGTGGGNVPMVMEPFCKSARGKFKGDAETWIPAKVANTLNTFDQGEARANELVVMEERKGVINLNKDDVQSKAVLDPNGIAPALYAGECRGGGGECYVMDTVALEGNGQRPSHRGDGYAETDKSYTLNATEVHGVAYSFDPGASRDVGVLFIEECGKTLTNGTCPGHHDGVVIATPTTPPTASKASFFMNADENIASTLVATDYKDPQLVCYEDDPIAIDRAYFNQGQNALYDPQTYEDGTTPILVARGPSAVATRYIVRRLTPTECARLQGFADRWGNIDPKTELTDEEYRFWLEVRNTHAAINGKAVKDYDKKQMLAWYNKLHTDSAEYKLWGNGIALPTALYVIQGIADTQRG